MKNLTNGRFAMMSFLAAAFFLMSNLWHAPLVRAAEEPQVIQQGETALNINEADAESLMKIKGIGPSLAEKIISHREANGPFESVDQLLEVKGIGKTKLDKMRTTITV